MKTIGILGGISPESTVEYYKGIIKSFRNIKGEDNYPQILINSINITEMIGYVQKKEFQTLTDFLVSNLNKLISANADLLAIASNTPHVVIDQILEKIDTPILNIVEETKKFAENKNLKKLLLTGTYFTMKSTFYQEELVKAGIECLVPDEAEMKTIQDIIFQNLVNGIVNENDKRKFLDICNRIIGAEKVDGVILGCTELPLLVQSKDLSLEILDTSDIHINSIVNAIVK